MPRIPQYQQDRLASSVVGTPGVDQSGNIAAQSIMQSAGALEAGQAQAQRNRESRRAQLSNIIANSFQEIGQELRVRQAQQAAYTKAQREIQDNALAHDHLANAKMDLDNRITQLQQEGRDDPAAAVKGFEGQYRQVFKDYAEQSGLKNRPDLMAKVQPAYSDYVASAHNTLTNWQLSETNRNLDARNEQTSTRILNGTTVATLDKSLSELQNQEDNYLVVHGAKGKVLLDGKKREAVTKAFNADVFTQPELVDAALKSGRYNDFIDGDTRKNIQGDIQAARNGIRIGAEHTEHRNALSTVGSMSVIYSEANANMKNPIVVATARRGMVDFLQAEIHKPEGQRNQVIIDKANTYIDKLDSTQQAIKASEEHAASMRRLAQATIDTQIRQARSDARQAKADIRQAENDAWTREQRTDKVVRKQAIENATTGPAMTARIKANALFGVATRQAKLGSPETELKNINAAMDAVVDVHEKYDLPFDYDTGFSNLMGELQERLKRVQSSIDVQGEKGDLKGQDRGAMFWQPTPEEEFHAYLRRGAPEDMVRKYAGAGMAGHKVELDTKFNQLYAKQLDKFESKEGRRPNTSELEVMRGRTSQALNGLILNGKWHFGE